MFCLLFFFWILLEHNHQLGTINNNNTSSINNNTTTTTTITKSGVNSTKLQNDDHLTQPQIASIHRNGKANSVPGGNKMGIVAAAVPQVQTKQIEHSSSQINGEQNENLMAETLSSSDPIECDAIDHCENLLCDTQTDQNVQHADKSLVALGILIQHLTFNVSKTKKKLFSMCACLCVKEKKREN